MPTTRPPRATPSAHRQSHDRSPPTHAENLPATPTLPRSTPPIASSVRTTPTPSPAPAPGSPATAAIATYADAPPPARSAALPRRPRNSATAGSRSTAPPDRYCTRPAAAAERRRRVPAPQPLTADVRASKHREPGAQVREQHRVGVAVDRERHCPARVRRQDDRVRHF